MAKPIKGVLRHQVPGRLRISLQPPLPDRDTLQSLASQLVAVEGTDEIEIRPQSGSLIIRHQGTLEDVAGAYRHAGLQIDLPAEPPASGDPIQGTLQRIVDADAAVQRLTGGRTDLWGVSFSLLVATGLLQLARGRVAGPALTLFGQAATLAMARPLKRFL